MKETLQPKRIFQINQLKSVKEDEKFGIAICGIGAAFSSLGPIFSRGQAPFSDTMCLLMTGGWLYEIARRGVKIAQNYEIKVFDKDIIPRKNKTSIGIPPSPSKIL